MKKIGLFGGSFDPIHLGHVNLALQLCEVHRLDEVLFCPAFQSPNKPLPMASPEHRKKMTELAIRDVPGFRFCNLELKREGISYTIDTLRALQKRCRDHAEIYLLLSEDSFHSFHLWKNPEEIVQRAHLLIGSRNHFQIKNGSSPFEQVFRDGWTETKLFDISSTDIRDRLKKNLYCGHLMDAKVVRYIQKHQLYI